MKVDDLIEGIRRLPDARRRKLVATLMADEDVSAELLTEKELAALLRVTQRTLREHLKNGPPKKRCAHAGDIRTIKSVMVGARRRWPRSAVMAFLKA